MTVFYNLYKEKGLHASCCDNSQKYARLGDDGKDWLETMSIQNFKMIQGEGPNTVSIDPTTQEKSKDNTIKIEEKGNAIETLQRCSINNSFIYMVGSNGKVKIGSNCNLNNVNLVVFGNCAIYIGHRLRWVKGTERAEDGGVITIGDDCLFSAEIMIRTSDGHAIFDAANKQRINPTKNVWIDNYVWLCHGSSVGKGCKVGTGTVSSWAKCDGIR